MFKHLRKYVPSLNSEYGSGIPQDPTDTHPANCYISLLEDGRHGVCLDLDMPCELIPSRTPGHFHLYINKALDWDDYSHLLTVLASYGIVEEGWVQSAKKTRCTVLRLPPDEYQFEQLKTQMEETGTVFP